MDTCKACRFYLPHIEAGGPVHTDRVLPEGSCRRYPPLVVRHTESLADPDFGFPIVAAGEWCGEFDRSKWERDDED